jgi:membrane protease YdiL (CAAX protease family)
MPGIVMASVTALREEIGWRGFLVLALARLLPASMVGVVSGLAWAAFHYPLLVLVPGGNHGLPLWYGLTTFTLAILAAAGPYVWLRMRTGSLWPAVLLRTSHNVLIYSVFEPLMTRASAAPPRPRSPLGNATRACRGCARHACRRFAR